MASTVVVGATGYLGRHIVAELHHRGHNVRAVVRDRARAEDKGPWGAPSLEGLVEEWSIGSVTDPQFTHDIAAGADHVVSALGVTRQKADPWEIDNRANLAVLDSALHHGAGSFTYINVLNAEQCPAELTRAKAAFARTLANSDITSQIINPPAYFSDMMEILAMAKRGVVTVLRPEARVNPIHGADLAEFTIDRLEQHGSGSWDIGGPQVFSWAEIAKTAFAAAGKRPRIIKLPRAILSAMLWMTALFNPRLADTLRFTTWNMLHDCVAHSTGSHQLADFYAQHLTH